MKHLGKVKYITKPYPMRGDLWSFHFKDPWKGGDGVGYCAYPNGFDPSKFTGTFHLDTRWMVTTYWAPRWYSHDGCYIYEVHFKAEDVVCVHTGCVPNTEEGDVQGSWLELKGFDTFEFLGIAKDIRRR